MIKKLTAQSLSQYGSTNFLQGIFNSVLKGVLQSTLFSEWRTFFNMRVFIFKSFCAYNIEYVNFDVLQKKEIHETIQLVLIPILGIE